MTQCQMPATAARDDCLVLCGDLTGVAFKARCRSLSVSTVKDVTLIEASIYCAGQTQRRAKDPTLRQAPDKSSLVMADCPARRYKLRASLPKRSAYAQVMSRLCN